MGGREACSGDRAGGFLGRLASLARGGDVFSSDLLNPGLRTDVAGLRFQWFYIVWAFQKQTFYWKGTVRNMVFFGTVQDYLKKKRAKSFFSVLN